MIFKTSNILRYFIISYKYLHGYAEMCTRRHDDWMKYTVQKILTSAIIFCRQDINSVRSVTQPTKVCELTVIKTQTQP